MKTLHKEPDKDLMKALEDYIKEIDTLQDRLSSRNEGLGFAGREQVADDIGELVLFTGHKLWANAGAAAILWRDSAGVSCAG